MTSYTRDSEDVIKLFMFLRDFEPEYHHANFGAGWTTNKGKTSGLILASRVITLKRVIQRFRLSNYFGKIFKFRDFLTLS